MSAWSLQALEGLLARLCFKVLSLLTLGSFPPLGSVAIVVEEQGKILVVERSDGRGFSLPGGMMRWNETLAQALRREVREETGYEVTVEGLVGIYSGEHGDERLRSVLIVYRGRLAGGSMHGSFEGQVRWLPPGDLRGRMAFDNEVTIEDYLTGRQRII